ncbi:hypothetical protein [Thermoflavimicrobium dichotomicum]|uniref:Glycine zipper n=1 Tax=Thermoflavimicrobium dichotomicum TaxID=46223 RepID=A0A1I3NBL0_9BACL|nr:hypothetical protein [Thermoflavimicrobium dichotomicum]SFJ06166.1 hypothetical protein SAMN05421852_10461 [Thermoflavimicrobium dichotomicum]
MKKLKLNSGSVWAGIITGVLSQIKDTVALKHGKIDRGEYAVHTAENISSAVGVALGIEYGAVLGTMACPGIGTAIGSILGGIVGDGLGRFIGQKTSNIVYNQPIIKFRANNVSVTNQVDCGNESENQDQIKIK